MFQSVGVLLFKPDHPKAGLRSNRQEPGPPDPPVPPGGKLEVLEDLDPRPSRSRTNNLAQPNPGLSTNRSTN